MLVIPKAHHTDLPSLARVDPALAGAVLATAAAVAEAEGLGDPGYRGVFNTGAGAGQTVFHAHVHLLAGRPFAWPPG